MTEEESINSLLTELIEVLTTELSKTKDPIRRQKLISDLGDAIIDYIDKAGGLSQEREIILRCKNMIKKELSNKLPENVRAKLVTALQSIIMAEIKSQY